MRFKVCSATKWPPWQHLLSGLLRIFASLLPPSERLTRAAGGHMGMWDLQAPAVEFLINAWAELPERWRSGPVQSPNPRIAEITLNHGSLAVRS